MGGFGGGIELDPIPSSWESGGGISGSKADLTELPGSASPLQFGDWIHLCRPVMRDLSSVASRRWDLTVRQAQVSSLCGLEASHGAKRPEDP